MSAYFDTVLDERMNPLYKGSPEEVLGWLEERRNDWRESEPPIDGKVWVCISKTMQMVTVEEYLRQFG